MKKDETTKEKPKAEESASKPHRLRTGLKAGVRVNNLAN
jgi:hypothetical protein